MAYVPPSKRGDPTWGQPVEGIPAYMVDPVWGWAFGLLNDVARRVGGSTDALVRTIRFHLKLDGPLSTPLHLKAKLIEPSLGIDVLDVLLHLPTVTEAEADRLREMLAALPSVWTVVRDGEDHALVRRGSGPISEVVEHIGPEGERSRYHLEQARLRLMRREPDPEPAYRHAVKAVEVAAKPVVEPNNPLSTLGSVIGALKANPDRWTFVLDGRTTYDVLTMCQSIWKAQYDRHGDESKPPQVSEEQADAAFHVAIALVRIFRAGHLRRA